jgi:hypothetical protein
MGEAHVVSSRHIPATPGEGPEIDEVMVMMMEMVVVASPRA